MGEGIICQLGGILLLHFGEIPLLSCGDENILQVWGAWKWLSPQMFPACTRN